MTLNSAGVPFNVMLVVPISLFPKILTFWPIFPKLIEGLALRDVGHIRRRNGVSKASLKCCHAK